jgi:hypothetical protein
VFTSRRRVLAPVLALTLVLSLAACGSDDGDTADDATTTAVADDTSADGTTADETATDETSPEGGGAQDCSADEAAAGDNLSGSAAVLFSADVDFGPTEADITGDTTLVYEGGVLSPGSLTVEVDQMFGIQLGADDSITAVLIGCSGGQTLVPGTTVGYLVTEPGTYELVDDLTSEVIGTVTAE